MVAYWDRDQRCRFANQAYKSWFGRGRAELLGISLEELLGPLYALNLPHIDAAYRGERQVFERAIPRPDGDGVRHSLATYVPHIVEGRVEGIFVHVADVEPLKRLEQELKLARDEAERLATHDHLNGLPNRRLLEDRLVEVIRRAKRTGRACSRSASTSTISSRRTMPTAMPQAMPCWSRSRPASTRAFASTTQPPQDVDLPLRPGRTPASEERWRAGGRRHAGNRARRSHAEGGRESSSKAAIALAAYINEGPPPT
jgi:PAS domain S-box-containing protein